MALAVDPVKKSDLWTLENADVAIGVQKSTGWIRSATWKNTGIDLFKQVRGGIPGYIGGIRVFDEHDRALVQRPRHALQGRGEEARPGHHRRQAVQGCAVQPDPHAEDG